MKTLLPKDKARALTRIEVLIIVAVLVVLAALFVPAVLKSTARSSRINCVNGLRQVGLGFRVWAGDNGEKYPMQISVTNGGTMELVQSGVVFPHFQVMSNELNTPKILFCPNETDRTRKMATIFAPPAVARGGEQVLFASDKNTSYFVGVDADQTSAAMFLAGDRNLEIDGVPAKPGIVSITTNHAVGWTRAMHNRQGNILLSDCSVQSLNGEWLARAVQATGVATNRLAIP
jgi:hypothetical protein